MERVKNCTIERVAGAGQYESGVFSDEKGYGQASIFGEFYDAPAHTIRGFV